MFSLILYGLKTNNFLNDNLCRGSNICHPNPSTSMTRKGDVDTANVVISLNPHGTHVIGVSLPTPTYIGQLNQSPNLWFYSAREGRKHIFGQ